MTLSEAERIVQKAYPGAFAFISGMTQGWSICNGTRCAMGENIRIVNVGWHPTIEEAWLKAAELVQAQHARYVAKNQPRPAPLKWKAIDFGISRKKAAALVATLTPREKEVAELIALGESLRLIAQRLGMALKTVEVHVFRLRKKLGHPELHGVGRIWFAALVGI